MIENVPNLKKELPRCTMYINEKIKRELGIQQPVLLVAPSLLSLKTLQGRENDEILGKVPAEMRPELLKKYNDDIADMYCRIIAGREKIISSRILVLCRRMQDDLKKHLEIEPDIYAETGRMNTPVASEEFLNRTYYGINKFFIRVIFEGRE